MVLLARCSCKCSPKASSVLSAIQRPELRSSSGSSTTSLLNDPLNRPPDENAVTDNSDDDWESDSLIGHEDGSYLERRINTEDSNLKQLTEADKHLVHQNLAHGFLFLNIPSFNLPCRKPRLPGICPPAI
ncbi:hypothetical protein F5B17DRAFT_304604 [Nemania serpens]|nr:hypothetical protein F5B17DRAFT_304604 [Nemania serpens]